MVLIVVLTVVMFGIVTVGIVSGFYWVSAESPVTQRLRTLVPDIAAEAKAKKGTGPSITARLLALLGTYSFAGSDSSLVRRLSYAGIRGPRSAVVFLGVRTLLSFGPAILIVVPRITSGRPLGYALFMAVLVWAWGHVVLNLWLRAKGARRMREIMNALPDTLDLMVTCLEAGLGLNATIARIGEERANMLDPLGREFSQVSFELRSGRTREDALRGLGDRNGVEDLKALAGLVIQSDRLGASMAQTLRSHADLLRTKRRQRAEEAARKLPIKMLFPLAFFILPALFIVVGGPAILRIGDLITMVTEH
jgi:tight adherence protein C